MIAKHHRNLRESTQPQPSIAKAVAKNHTLAEAGALVFNEELIRLANEANKHIGAGDAFYKTAIIHYAKAGAALLKAQESYKDKEDFEFYRNQYIRVGRSQAYSYMRLAREMPQLLEESVQLNGLPNLSQAIALLSAPEEVKTEVMQRIEDGEDVKIKEIERLKAEKKTLEIENRKLTGLYTESIYEQTALEEKTEQMQNSINVEVLNQLKTKLSEIELAADPVKVKELNDQIEAKKSELRQLNKQVANADKNAVYREVFKNFLKQITEMQFFVGVEDTQISSYEYSTIGTLKLARHEINALVTQITAVIEQHDDTIEFED